MRFRFARSVATSTGWTAPSSFRSSSEAPTRRVSASTIEKLIEDKMQRAVRAGELAPRRGRTGGRNDRSKCDWGRGGARRDDAERRGCGYH
jgi:hypothetical protein